MSGAVAVWALGVLCVLSVTRCALLPACMPRGGRWWIIAQAAMVDRANLRCPVSCKASAQVVQQVSCPAFGQCVKVELALTGPCVVLSCVFLSSQPPRWDRKYWATYKVLDILQKVFYRSNPAREAFVEMCEDSYVQKMTFDSYLYKTVVPGG